MAHKHMQTVARGQAPVEHNEREGGPSAKRIELISGVLSWIVSRYCSLYANVLETRRFRAMFSDDQNARMHDRAVACRNSNMGARNRHLGTWRYCCHELICPVGLSDVSFPR